MHILELYIKSFRNYDEVNLNFSDGINIIYGPNGWGKSNLLEAIFLVSVGRDPWGAEIDELVRFGDDFAILKAKWEKRNSVELRLMRGGAKEIFLNEKRLRRLSSLVGLFPVSIAGPQDVELVRGSPKIRRRMLDLHISQISRQYLDDLSRFQVYLKNRNKILKDMRDGVEPVGGEVYLDSWDEKLAECGVRIIEERMKFLGDLAPFSEEFYRKLAGEDVRFEFSYESTVKPESGTITFESFVSALQSSREKEIKLGETLIGPHRDDFDVLVDGRRIRVFGSWGECRSASLAIVLGIAKLLEKIYASSPVIILDDCFANLDEKRMENLVTILSSMGQVFASTPVETDILNHRASKRFILVAPGKFADVK